MKLKISAFAIIIFLLNSCISIPNETTQLSKVIGKDLIVLHNSHRKIVELYYEKIINSVNTFIDKTYSPFVIHYVLKAELKKYNNSEESLYGTIEAAGKSQDKTDADNALNIMSEFLSDANNQIEKKRAELLNPILKQKQSLLDSLDKSYKNVIYANSTITGYLESIKKVKNAQNEALSIVGLKKQSEDLTSTLYKASDIINNAVKEGEEIDIKNNNAFGKIEEIANKIKNITNSQ